MQDFAFRLFRVSLNGHPAIFSHMPQMQHLLSVRPLPSSQQILYASAISNSSPEATCLLLQDMLQCIQATYVDYNDSTLGISMVACSLQQFKPPFVYRQVLWRLVVAGAPGPGPSGLPCRLPPALLSFAPLQDTTGVLDGPAHQTPTPPPPHPPGPSVPHPLSPFVFCCPSLMYLTPANKLAHQ